MKSVYLRDADVSRIQSIFKRYDEVIEEIGEKTLEEIEKDLILSKAIKLDLAQIGEHVKHLPTALKKYFTDVEYAAMMKMRNLIIHEYETVALKIVFNTIRDIITPAIKRLRSSELIQKL